MSRNCSNDCSNCEMLNTDEYIVIIEKNGLSENRRILNAFKCSRFGQYSLNIEELPKSDIIDDFIYK